jgi:hypothetical protein
MDSKWTYLIIVSDGDKIKSVGGMDPYASGKDNYNTEQGFVEDLGEDGWELVAAVPYGLPETETTKMYFKREK